MDFAGANELKELNCAEDFVENKSRCSSVDLAASEETLFDTHNMLSIFAKKSNTSDCGGESITSGNTWLEDKELFDELESCSFSRQGQIRS